jgi:hypothetical protein
MPDSKGDKSIMKLINKMKQDGLLKDSENQRSRSGTYYNTVMQPLATI